MWTIEGRWVEKDHLCCICGKFEPPLNKLRGSTLDRSDAIVWNRVHCQEESGWWYYIVSKNPNFIFPSYWSAVYGFQGQGELLLQLLAVEAVDWWEVAIVAPRNFVAPSDIDLVQASVSSIRWFIMIFFPSKTIVTHLSGWITRFDSWLTVYTVSVCSSREPEMIERLSAYALALWGSERVNLGVWDTLDFMIGGWLQIGKNFVHSSWQASSPLVWDQPVPFFLFTVIFIKNGCLTVRVVLQNCAEIPARFITGILDPPTSCKYEHQGLVGLTCLGLGFWSRSHHFVWRQ